MYDLPIGVNAILFNNKGYLLLGKRKNSFGDGTYSLIGGHLKSGETIEECMIRELYEEIGIIVKEEHVQVINFAFVSINMPMIEIGVLIKNYSGEPYIKEPMYCSELRYFSLDELPSMFIGTRVNVELYLKNCFYDSSCNVY